MFPHPASGHVSVKLAIVVFVVCAVMLIVRSMKRAGRGHIPSIMVLACVLGPTLFLFSPSHGKRSARVHSVQVSSGAASVSLEHPAPVVVDPPAKRRVVLSGLAIGVFLYLVYLVLDGATRGSIVRPSVVIAVAGLIGLCIAITRVH